MKSTRLSCASFCKRDIYKCLKKYNNSSIVGAETVGVGSQALSPVLCYGSETMDILDVRLLLDMVVSGTVSTMLARRWECSLLVNVGNETLKALLNNPKATEALKKAKKEVSDSMSKTEKKELTQEEKEIRFKRNELGNLSVQTIQRNVPDLYGTEQTRKRTSWLWDTKITVEEMRRVKNIYYMENHTRFYYRFTKG